MAELSQSEVVYLVLIGSLGMLIFVAGFALFITIYQKRMLMEQEKRRVLELEYQQKMIQAQIDSQEAERKRIAADLHDSIGSLLWAAKLNVGFLGRSVNLEGELTESYRETMNLLDKSIDSVKRISWELSPEAIQHNGLSSSIRELCSRIDGKGISLMFQEIGSPVFWSDHRALIVFRIVQELINNAVKHAQAKRVKVELNWKSDSLSIEVSDDGVGFKPTSTIHAGLGWWNITNRSKRIGATVRVNEQVQTGAAIDITVPFQAQ